MQSIGAATIAFRESFFDAAPLGEDPSRPDAFDAWEARRARYAIYWAHYQNDVYRRIHAWAQQYKQEYGLYKSTRGTYNPAYRLGEFWPAHLMGGSLDSDMGDGKSTPSAIPIETKHAGLRPVIGKVLLDSHWAVNKAVWTRHGAVMGDCCLKPVADAVKGQVRLEVIHPGTVRWVRKDTRGHVKEYILEEPRFDPMQTFDQQARAPKVVTYSEEALRDGETLIVRTYRNGRPFDWDGRPSVQEFPLGFTPLVLTQHLNVGLDFGLAEMHAGRAKFDEVNDLGSKLHDQVRKLVEGAWLFAGVPDPALAGRPTPRAQGPAPTAGSPEPDRQGMKVFYGDQGASAHSLVAPIPIADVTAEIRASLDGVEDDYPELRFERLRTGGTISGEALRVARQPVETKVLERRAGYDDGLTRAVQMAIALGGYLGFPGYEGYGLDSYAAGALDFRIGARPVFAPDELDRIAERQARYVAIGAAITAGIPRAVALAEAGYTPQQVAEIEDATQAEAETQLQQMKRQHETFGATADEEDEIPTEDA